MAATLPKLPVIVTEGDLDDKVEWFIDHLRANNVSGNTVYAYVGAVASLAEFLKSNDLPTETREIERRHIEKWQVWLQDQGYKDTTVHQRFRGAQRFFSWFESVMDDLGESSYRSPMAKMSPPKLGNYQPRVLSFEDLKRIVGSTIGKSFEERRDEALLRVFFDTGARRAEVAGLRWSRDKSLPRDIDLAEKTIYVVGKGDKDRYVHISPKTRDALRIYLALRDKHPHHDLPWLWLGRKGRLTDSGIAQTIRDIGLRAGIPNLHAHDLRHAWRHHQDLAGTSREDLMALGGWSSDAMLRRYASTEANQRALIRARQLNLGDKL
jgi:site-specific recombinase XerD